MEIVPSTYEILAWKFFDKDVDERWADWAVEMMQAGFDTESLPMLALLEKPYNQFELNELTDNIFNELGLNYNDKEIVIKNYVHYLIDLGLNRERELTYILETIRDVYYALDYDSNYYDFYLLHYAKSDLTSYGSQYYWGDVDRSTIDDEVIRVFKKWRHDNPVRKQ